jgi:hypothetical protein
MAAITINTKKDFGTLEAFSVRTAVETIVNNLSKENLQYIASLCDKPGADENFNKLKKNPLVKAML